MANKKIPLRRCVGCGEMFPKKELIRVIKTPEDEIVVDMTSKKNGRGAYICNNVECFSKAKKNKGLEKTLKSAISCETYDSLEKEIRNAK
ncbi:RNase P modulator RnpM [Lachnobacterium bovis]|jgi:predicted RNA-binding protein YlxR (DUF448 family)|uniref:YlxR domain-containing protein n=1 Tax=Lachnobacterium bovis TaxID=140626 RepID=A0A1H9QL96_9FIRM|nr:YlxR family protein [Lachnobacterium bovis]SER60629.1 hypothetical protein SAMN02910429_00579 [Lachnobacterium bovis]